MRPACRHANDVTPDALDAAKQWKKSRRRVPIADRRSWPDRSRWRGHLPSKHPRLSESVAPVPSPLVTAGRRIRVAVDSADAEGTVSVGCRPRCACTRSTFDGRLVQHRVRGHGERGTRARKAMEPFTFSVISRVRP